MTWRAWVFVLGVLGLLYGLPWYFDLDDRYPATPLAQGVAVVVIGQLLLLHERRRQKKGRT